MKQLTIILITIISVSCNEICGCDVVTYSASGRELNRQKSTSYCEEEVIWSDSTGKSEVECDKFHI